jgi:hypothetical protein
MNKLLGILVCMAQLAFATSAFCGSPELVKVLEEREFWNSYSWDKFDESALYKSTTWTLAGMSKRGDVKISDNYVTPVSIESLPVRELNMSVNAVSNHVNSYSFYSYNQLTTDDHRTFVKWCVEKFGAPEKEEEKHTENLDGVSQTTFSAFWMAGSTRITIKTRNNLSNGPASVGFITTLSFEKAYRPNVTLIGTTESSTQNVEGARPSIAIPDTQSGIRMVPAPPPPPRKTVESVPALPYPRSIPTKAVFDPPTLTDEKHYQAPPYIWESESGGTTVANDISSVPEEKRPHFELKR